MAPSNAHPLLAVLRTAGGTPRKPTEGALVSTTPHNNVVPPDRAHRVGPKGADLDVPARTGACAATDQEPIDPLLLDEEYVTAPLSGEAA